DISESKINHDRHENQRASFFCRSVFFTSIIYLFIYSSCYSQYHAGIGGRVAKFNSGLTMKYFFRPDNATGISVLIAHSKISKGGWVISPIYENQLPFHIPIIQL